MNKKNDKNNTKFALVAEVCAANFFEIEAKHLDFIGGGTNGEIENPINR